MQVTFAMHYAMISRAVGRELTDPADAALLRQIDASPALTAAVAKMRKSYNEAIASGFSAYDAEEIAAEEE